MTKLLYMSTFILLANISLAQNQKKRKNAPIYMNEEASVEERVNDLMSRMNLEDKAAQMSQYVGLEHMKIAENDMAEDELEKSDDKGFYPGFKVQDIENMTKAGKIGSFLHVLTAEEANELQKLAMQAPLKIPLIIGIDAVHGNALYYGATVYPSPITQAATFNDVLQKKANEETALEMRATGTHWSFTPNIDVLRDPRWGRSGETFGEDPYLVGNMGVATILGLQSTDFTGTNHVIACAKHLIAGSQSLNGLNAAPTDISKRTLYEMFLPPWKRAIKEANIYSIMAAHNEVNGMPGHMDKSMMTDLLRNQWGFEGFYVSDWNDIARIAIWHHTAKDFKQSVEFSVGAGMDMNMHGPYFADHVVTLVNAGKLTPSRIDDAVRKILEAKFRLGLFENPFVDLDKRANIVFAKAHQQTALEQARQGLVLLKNDGILPFKKTIPKNIFITGPNMDNMTILGDWASPQPEEHLITVKEGLEKLAGNYGFNLSYDNIPNRSIEITDKHIAEAKMKAKAADMTILVLGENSYRHDWNNKTTGENVDRAMLALSGNQLNLAKAIHATGKPFIVIYVSGSIISEPWLEDNANAILNAFEPGIMGGQAIAEVLFGDVNPSGKLPVTMPRSVGQLQMVYNHKPTMYIHRYNSEKKTPLHPFGFGMSYTTFELSAPKVSKTSFSGKDDKMTVEVEVENIGQMSGDEVIQLYIRDNISSYTRPVKELKAYQRVSLKPGEKKTVSLQITAESLAMYDSEFRYVVEEGEFTIMTGNSSDDKDLKSTVITVSETIYLKD